MNPPPTVTRWWVCLSISLRLRCAFRLKTRRMLRWAMLCKGDYEVDPDRILGRGAFGTVHIAKHKEDGEKVAAKRVDGKNDRTMKEMEKGLAKLQNLKHENIVQVFQVFRNEMTVWVFMELCDQRDLSEYFEEKRQEGIQVPDKEKLKLMLDIAKGVEYLHSKNIIHRDIKPSNLLRRKQNRGTLAKLTDFDCSKFLEEPYTTSLMTTNAGTPAFKAPEFWIRTPQGELNYHRNVDIYAMGLTFLAMIQENKGLVPRIETPNEPSEVGIPVGLIMWERQRFGTKPLQVVKLEKINDLAEVPQKPIDGKVRKEVVKMTHVKPAERISADQVVKGLIQIMESPAATTGTQATDADEDADVQTSASTDVPCPTTYDVDFFCQVLVRVLPPNSGWPWNCFGTERNANPCMLFCLLWLWWRCLKMWTHLPILVRVTRNISRFTENIRSLSDGWGNDPVVPAVPDTEQSVRRSVRKAPLRRKPALYWTKTSWWVFRTQTLILSHLWDLSSRFQKNVENIASSAPFTCRKTQRDNSLRALSCDATEKIFRWYVRAQGMTGKRHTRQTRSI